MDLSAIGSASIDMHLAQTQQSVQVAVVKKAMDVSESLDTQLIQQLQSLPSFGHQLDVTV